MTLMEFQRDFGTEDQCRAYLFKKRWPDGFKCPECGHAEHFNIKSRNLHWTHIVISNAKAFIEGDVSLS